MYSTNSYTVSMTVHLSQNDSEYYIIWLMTNEYETTNSVWHVDNQNKFQVFQSFSITKAESLLARLEHVAFDKKLWDPSKKLQFPRNNKWYLKNGWWNYPHHTSTIFHSKMSVIYSNFHVISCDLHTIFGENSSSMLGPHDLMALFTWLTCKRYEGLTVFRLITSLLGILPPHRVFVHLLWVFQEALQLLHRFLWCCLNSWIWNVQENISK